MSAAPKLKLRAQEEGRSFVQLEEEDGTMSTFIMLTRLDSEASRSPQALERLEKQAMDRVRAECPKVQWVASYAALGPYDYVDIFHADDVETATRVSTLIRACGHAHTEVWPATEWSRFKEMMRSIRVAA
jgi:uncharacterized protein with GYD domain